MTQPTAYSGRPRTPAPGTAASPEMTIARLRSHARRMCWPALVVIAAAGAVGFFTGNLPEPFQDWMLWSAAGVVVVLLAVVPYLRWLSRTYTITTKRVIARSGLFSRDRTDLAHSRGYTIGERRGPLQRLWGTGTLTLSNGVDTPIRLVDIASVRLVHEALADQIEVGQILAHRDSHGVPLVRGRG
ncbi:PH domain-containing protein [Microbacterium dauci]|uniref:PH domain-containing protein n=1 Tax=Microbacterium dauci TaxID=3048008 RepID=A0ABT6Z9T9_9MICO|nr:PH domain-containing protein [Microbacterium sp. LX3-4]MDJ1112925.1 PH domain-containing protein [Microbacterium sp. LX3-4]